MSAYFPTVKSLPGITREQMVEVDRIVTDELRIDLVQMMELAGRALARVARDRFLDGDAAGRSVAVLAGAGGNGGGALAAARNLHNWGATPQMALDRPAAAYHGVPAHQAKTLQHLGIELGEAHRSLPGGPPELIIDGLIGYSLRGAPRGRMAALVRWANGAGCPVLSLDLPSGLDATTGEPQDPVIHAAATVTLGLPKTGLARREARALAGELYLADIGIPPAAYQRIGLPVASPFGQSDIVRVTGLGR